MAFSKAKLLRFNDIKSCAPPPGAYNPKYDELLSKTPSKTPCRTKKEVVEPPSPASSWTDVKSVRSCISNFRTPTIPKRKKLNLFNSVGKKSTSVKLFSPEKAEELREKIVECKNKDETITDLEILIEELKQGINHLNAEKEILIEEKNKTVEQVQDIQVKFDDVKLQLKESKTKNKDMLNNLLVLKDEINDMRQYKDIILPLMEDKVEQKSKYCLTLEKEIQANRQEITKLKTEYEEEIDNLNLVKNEALEELKFVRLELEEVNSLFAQTTSENENIKQTYEMMQKGLNELKESQDIIRPLLEDKLNLKTNYCESLIHELEEKEEEISELKLQHTEEIDNITTEKHEALAQLEIVQTELEDVSKQLMQTVLENDIKETYEMLKESETREAHELLKPFIEEYEALLKEAEDKLEDKTKYCEELELQLHETQEEMVKIKKQYEESLQAQADLQGWYVTNTESVKKQYQTEIEDMEYELLKIVTDSQKKLLQNEKDSGIQLKEMELNYEQLLQQIKNDYELQLFELKNDTEAQIRQSDEDCCEKIKLAEIQMEENCKEINLNWELKLQEQETKSAEILKECQAIAEFNIIQCEVEKNETKKRLAENEEILRTLNLEKETLLSENTELKSEMSQIIIELNDARAKLGSEIDLRQQDLETILAEKHCYEITINKTYNTVHALKTRLLHSDRDVEQLKEELENLETSKLEIEFKYLQLTEEVQHIKKINAHLKCENLLLKEIQDKVVVLERDLLDKVDNLKLKSDLEIANLNKIINEKQETVNELNSYIQNQQELHSGLHSAVSDARNEIERQETEFIEYKFKISRLESSLNSSNKELLLQGKTLEKKLMYINDLEENLKENDKQIDEITNTYKKYVEKTKHLTDLQQKHETLLQKCISLEKMVADQKKANETIRYLIHPKKNKSDNKNEFEDKIVQQNKTIDKLKQEIAHLSKMKRRSKSMAAEKENVCSPVRSQVLNSLMDSPASPLKERN